MDQIQDISNRITRIIEDAPDHSLLGVRLGASIKQSFPDFHPALYGSRNLRHFIRTYVSEVAEKRHSGTDVVYTLAGSPNDPPSGLSFTVPLQPPLPGFEIASEPEPLPVKPLLWKAYSNPAYRFALAVNRETGEIRMYPVGMSASDPWTIITKPGADAHVSIAKDFVETLSGVAQTTLQRELVDSKWYVRFSTMASKMGVGPRWTSFRRRRLIALFNAALGTTLASKPQTPTPIFGLPDQNIHPGIGLASATSLGDDIAARTLILRAIAELPLSELRSIRLPVGAVLDALKRQ
jgi:hypothetical protein